MAKAALTSKSSSGRRSRSTTAKKSKGYSVTVRCRATNCPPHTGEKEPPRCSNHKTFKIRSGSPDPQWTCGTHLKKPCRSDPDRKGCGRLPSKPPAATHPYVNQFKSAAKRAGVAAAWATDPNTINIVWKESEFDPCGRNQGGTASGLFQLIMQTWYAYAPKIPHGTFNIEDQAYVGFLYIQDRYGTPAAAWAHKMKYGTY